MSILKDFNELHLTFRSFLFGFIITIPFWYFDLYLFHKTFFLNNVFYIPIVAAFCLSLCWYCINLLSGILFSQDFLFNKDKQKVATTNDYIMAIITSIGWLSLLTYFSYSFKFGIITFINICFISSILRLVLWVIIGINKTKN
jgi:hypothetical protein